MSAVLGKDQDRGGQSPRSIERSRRARFELERRYHRLLAAEDHADRRGALYEEAYGKLYELWAEENAQKSVFGYQESYVRLLAPLVRGRTVLDFGCGFGRSTIEFARTAARSIGIETNDGCVESARRAAEKEGAQNVEFRKATGALLPLQDECVDVMFSNDVAEHLHPDDLLAHLRQARRVLKPGGRYVCITPNAVFGPHDVSKLYLPTGAAPEGLHLREYTSAELGDVFRAAGFRRARSLLFSSSISARLGALGALPLISTKLKTRLEKALRRVPLLVRALGLETVIVVATR